MFESLPSMLARFQLCVRNGLLETIAHGTDTFQTETSGSEG